MALEKQEHIAITNKPEFIHIIDRCIKSLEQNFNSTDSETARDILISRMINDIRLGNTDVMIRLSALNTIFEHRHLFKNPNSDLVHIQYAYEDLLKETTDEAISKQIKTNLNILKNELVTSYFDHWDSDHWDS